MTGWKVRTIATVLFLLGGPAIAQPQKNFLPGCGPGEEALFNEGVAARESAFTTAQATLTAYRTELASATEERNKVCGVGMTGTPACVAANALVSVAREAVGEASQAVTSAANLLNGYRTQQPFVTPTGGACLRCKEAGPWNCANPGTSPGFTPKPMPVAVPPPSAPVAPPSSPGGSPSYYSGTPQRWHRNWRHQRRVSPGHRRIYTGHRGYSGMRRSYSVTPRSIYTGARRAGTVYRSRGGRGGGRGRRR